MTHDEVQRWLDRYVEAWRTNDPAQVEALFTEDGVYRYRPYGGDEHAAVGREAIVQAWMEEGDPPGSWEAQYEPWAVEGNRAVAVGRSDYLATEKAMARRFHNAFLLTFATDGRCADFTEYYMREEAS